MSETTGLSSASGGHILEPMSLVSIRFLEQGDNRPAEVLPLCRGEILGTRLVELVGETCWCNVAVNQFTMKCECYRCCAT